VKNKYISLSAAALLSGALLQPVYAEEAMSGFAALDTDNNGAISAEEAQANETLSSSWTSLDANLDGQIDEAEFSAMEMETPKSE
jgi:Ca2+-binding EF-hand superfamily protein